MGHTGSIRAAMVAFAVSSLVVGAAASTASAAATAPPRRSPAQAPDVPLATTGNIQKSANWSGYAETGGPFTSVSASWNVPTAQETASGTYAAGQWIGIDGDGNSHLIQTGTVVETVAGESTYGVWWEILPKASHIIDEPVSPGETITASIAKQTSRKWLITISNGTWTFQTTEKYKGPGASAEAIVEAPELGSSIASMEDTSDVTFSSLLFNGANPELPASDAIECVQKRKVVESPSKPAGGDSFTMAYGATAPPPPALP